MLPPCVATKRIGRELFLENGRGPAHAQFANDRHDDDHMTRVPCQHGAPAVVVQSPHALVPPHSSYGFGQFTAAIRRRSLRRPAHRQETRTLTTGQVLPPPLPSRLGEPEVAAIHAATNATLQLWVDELDFPDRAEHIAVEARFALTLTARIKEVDERIAVLIADRDPAGVIASVPGDWCRHP